MPKVTVIIPVFNAAAYVERAVRSVLMQTLGDVEVIAVNDGSTDASRDILEHIAELDSRLKVINIPNGGVSNARQTGLDEAIGEYVIHCDADDYMDSDYLLKLYDKAQAEDADVVICDFFKDNPDGMVRVSQKPDGFKPLQLQKQLFHTLHGSVWNKLVRTSLLHAAGAPRFTPGITCKEDWLLLQQLLDGGDVRTVYAPVAGYHYVTNPCSITMASHDRVKNLTNDINIIAALERLDAMADAAFAREVASRKLRVKFDMLLSRAFSWREILACYPEVNGIRAAWRSTLPLKVRGVLILFMLKTFSL